VREAGAISKPNPWGVKPGLRVRFFLLASNLPDSECSDSGRSRYWSKELTAKTGLAWRPSGAEVKPMKYEIGFCGSRKLSAGRHGAIVDAVVKQALKAGRVVTGCATGADEMVLRSSLSSTVGPMRGSLMVFTVLDSNGTGEWNSTARASVLEAAARGATVEWEAAEDRKMKITARLRSRTLRMVNFLGGTPANGLISFWTDSPGTRLTMVEAGKKGIRLIAYPLEGHPLPDLGEGYWYSRSGLFEIGDPRNASFIWCSRKK
jgi:hypothetical protein